MARKINIYANFDTTAVTDPEREYYNLPRNELPVFNQTTASTSIEILPSSPVDKLVLTVMVITIQPLILIIIILRTKLFILLLELKLEIIIQLNI